MDELQLRFSQPLLQCIIPLLPSGISIYLVGGAVRDAFLNRPSYDLDFVTSGDAMKIARKLADDLGAAYFPLDSVRNVARLILRPDEKLNPDVNKIIRVDFSTFQSADLFGDLQGRDFTMNAMAVEVHQLQTLVDPMNGSADLINRQLRSCSPRSFLEDPVRILRAVRFSVDIQFNIVSDTLEQMREAVCHLPEVSAERVRDELFRILVNVHPSTALRILDRVGALEYVLPEVCFLKDVQQSPPHIMDAWNHTLDYLIRLESLLDVLKSDYNPDMADNLSMGLVALRLGRYRQQLTEHLYNTLNPERPHRGLLFLAGLYHDVGKLATRSADEFEKTKFIGHEQIGSNLVEKRGQALKLSNLEIERLVTIVRKHMRPALLSHTIEPPSKKAVYHFFRDTGAAGIDICVLSLADVLATYGPTLPEDRWIRHLDVVRTLLDAWWEDREERICPPPFVNGDDLMRELATPAGPVVGYLLESIREAQVIGRVKNRQEAINLAREILDENLNNKRAM